MNKKEESELDKNNEDGKGGLGFIGTVFAIIVAVLILCVC